MKSTIAGLLAALVLGTPLVEGGRVETRLPQQPASPALTASELDLLLAPVALYPDALLAQMLMASATPDKIVELNAWLKKNAAVKGTELQAAAEAQGYPPSLIALALFPQVVDQMASDPQWTSQVGQAFTSDRKAVLASVQRLRAQSKAVGTLTSTPQQQVETRTTDSGQQVIVIESTNPQVVYVPQYNPQTVYTQPSTNTVVVQDDDDDDGAAVAGAAIGFATGIAIGAAMDNNYYYGPYGYRGGAYMYNDAWDDYYDARDDARDDWQDHREDMVDERSERAGQAQEQRTERQQTRQENPPTQAQRDQARTQAQAAQQSRSTSQEARGYSSSGQTRGTAERSGTRSDAFSGYSSGKSERAASSRGKSSRSSSGGGRSRRR
jgi:Protein of unknown function (DUF3300)